MTIHSRAKITDSNQAYSTQLFIYPKHTLLPHPSQRPLLLPLTAAQHAPRFLLEADMRWKGSVQVLVYAVDNHIRIWPAHQLLGTRKERQAGQRSEARGWLPLDKYNKVWTGLYMEVDLVGRPGTRLQNNWRTNEVRREGLGSWHGRWMQRLFGSLATPPCHMHPAAKHMHPAAKHMHLMENCRGRRWEGMWEVTHIKESCISLQQFLSSRQILPGPAPE